MGPVLPPGTFITHLTRPAIMRICRPALSLAIVCLAGCTVYRHREVEVAVRDAETHQPIPGAVVHVSNPHTGADPITATAGPVGIAPVPFTPAAGEPVMIEAMATSYTADSVVVGEAAVAAVPPSPFIGPAMPRPADFTVELYAAPRFGVELVVPPGYRGLLRVDLNFKDDIPIPKGQRVFPFTASATGEIKGTGPGVLRRVPVSEFKARTTDGTPIGGQPDPEGVDLRWLRRDEGCEVFVLGTQADFDKYRKDSPHDPTTQPPTDKKGGGRGGKGGGRRGGGGGGSGMGG
jgi:hypothetical protein